MISEKAYLQEIEVLSNSHISDEEKVIIDDDTHKYVISYFSVNRHRFDLLTCILALYDSFMVPIYLSIGPQAFS